jgi:hypothetical protein
MYQFLAKVEIENYFITLYKNDKFLVCAHYMTKLSSSVHVPDICNFHIKSSIPRLNSNF